MRFEDVARCQFVIVLEYDTDDGLSYSLCFRSSDPLLLANARVGISCPATSPREVNGFTASEKTSSCTVSQSRPENWNGH